MKQSHRSHPRGDRRERTPSKQTVRARTQAIWKRALGSALVAALLIGVQSCVEHTDAGEQLELATYAWLQHRLKSNTSPPIVVVDISRIRPESITGAQNGEEATPRGKLLELLTDLTAHAPLAIGVDIDFSPELEGRVPITPDDFTFFEDCLRLNRDRKVPIYLGVQRTLSLPRESWLGRPAYQDLAAGILAPKKHLEMMVGCVERNGDTCQNHSLAARLAKQLNDAGFGPGASGGSPPSRLLERITDHRLTDGFYAGLFPVDYGELHELTSKAHTMPSSEIREHGEFVRGKVVLLGDATPEHGADTFVVPGESEPITGVYVHASAVYTLALAPLYTFRSPWLIDAALALMLIAILSAVQWAFRRSSREPREDRIQGALIVLFVGLVVVFSASVQWHRILWPGFAMVIFGLLMHPRVEHWAETALHWQRRRAADLLDYFVPKEG